MVVFHGTDFASAEKLAKRPQQLDLTMGGGELGRGFYTGNHIGLAMSWAKGKDPRGGRVLEITITAGEYAGLSRKTLTHQQVCETKEWLEETEQDRTFVFGFDVVEGPIAPHPQATQYKFESERAGGLLKESKWKVHA